MLTLLQTIQHAIFLLLLVVMSATNTLARSSEQLDLVLRTFVIQFYPHTEAVWYWSLQSICFYRVLNGLD